MPSLKATQVDPVEFDAHLKFTDGRVPYQHVYAALKYHKEGVKLSLFQVDGGDQRLYCVLHEIFEER
jgi:hypothetical protein